MKWTVGWSQSALDDLAALWTASSNRQAVSDAADKLEQELRIDADLKGEEYYRDRLLSEPPIGLAYALFPSDCRVEVIQVVRADWRNY
jgi:hypothetical protein